MKTKIIKAILLIVLSATVFSCGGKSHSKSKQLGIMLWAANAQLPLWKRLKVDFEKANPDIKIKYFISSWRGYNDKMMTRLTSGAAQSGIDLVKIPNLGDIAGRNVLMDLTKYFNGKDLPKQSEFIDRVIESSSINNKIIAYPFGVDADVLVINKDIFRKSGVTVPTGPYSFSQFKDMVKKTSSGDPKKNGSKVTYGFSLDVHPSRYLPFILSAGGKIYDPKTKTVNFNTAKTREILKMFYDFIAAGYMPTLDANNGGTMVVFQQGTLAMFYSGKYLIPEIKNNLPFEWDIIPLPSTKGVKQITGSQESIFGVTKGTKRVPEAVKFLKFLTSDKGYRQLIRSGEYTPTLKKIANSEAFLKEGTGKNKLFLDSYLGSRKFFYENNKANAEITEAMNKEVWSYLLLQDGKLEETCVKVNENLARFYTIK